MSLIKYNDRSLRNLTTAPAAITGNSPGALVHIKTLTASSSANLSFVNGASSVVLDNTYPIYKFEFINIHPATNNAEFVFNVSTDAGSNYNLAKTTTWFQSYHNEGDSAAGISYETSQDLAQGTGTAIINYNMGTDNDENLSGEMYLFNPSSTTFVKHFIARTNNTEASGYSIDAHMAGYVNSTSDVDAIQFSASSGNIDAGQIKLYGIKDA